MLYISQHQQYVGFECSKNRMSVTDRKYEIYLGLKIFL